MRAHEQLFESWKESSVGTGDWKMAKYAYTYTAFKSFKNSLSGARIFGHESQNDIKADFHEYLAYGTSKVSPNILEQNRQERYAISVLKALPNLQNLAFFLRMLLGVHLNITRR